MAGLVGKTEVRSLWSPEELSEWRSRKGPLALAQKLSDLGWSGRESLAAFAGRKTIKRDTNVSDAPAQYWQAQGGSLADALKEPYPPVPGTSLMNIRRDWHDGSLELITVWTAQEIHFITRTRRSPAGRWSQQRKQARGNTLAGVLAHHYKLRECSTRFAVEYEFDDSTMLFDEFANQLRPAPDEPEVEWTANREVAERWEGLLGEVAIPEHPCVIRWVTVNGSTIVWILLDGRTFPLAEDGPADFRPLNSRVVATSVWTSEYGGIRSEMHQLNPRLYLEMQWSDEGTERGLHVIDGSMNALAQMLGDWVVQKEAQVEAAFALRPQTSKAQSRSVGSDAWERFALVASEVTFEVSDRVQRLIREYLLGIDKEFRLACDALARPDSEDGQALLSALDLAIEDEDPARLRIFYGK